MGAIVAVVFLVSNVIGGAAFADAPLVIWISLDGVRHDYPERLRLPGLERLATQGARAARLTPIFPTSTFSNHVALATCTRADRHGIVGNQFHDPMLGDFDYDNDARFINAEPIWATAERQGLRSASFFWVGSETAWRGTAASYRISPFDSEIGEATKVDQILAWVDLPPDERPGLVLSWWHGADRAGHLNGPNHPDVGAQLAEQDQHLRRLLDGLDDRSAWPYTTVIVTSDHGMTAGTREIDIYATMLELGIESRIHSGGAVTFLSVSDPSKHAQVASAMRAIEGQTVYAKDALPDALRIGGTGRTGDFVLVATPPYFYTRSGPFAAITAWLLNALGYEKGIHGYSPDHPDMAGIFFAMGRGIKQGARPGTISNLDVAPTVSHLLDIDPPRHCEGAKLREILGEQR